ncbi:MAG: hypothetical protein HPZ91_03565 [Lentisphaeria bacterium]|nr:hypothetical protein [Lentisphaeria bacterium]
MDEEEQLMTTGRVIDATRKIESKLIECGATGSGLREKADSLGSGLPEEAGRLIHFIGNIRNRFAHESGATLRPDELELFEEAAAAVLAELDRLAGAPPPAVEPEKPPKKAAAPSPKPPREIPEAPEEPEAPAPQRQEPVLPPWDSPVWAALPGLHLVYAFRAGWNAFGAGQLYLLLVLAELIALTLLGFAVAYMSGPLAASGGTLLLIVYLCGVWLGLRKTEKVRRPGLYLVPVANIGWFAKKIAEYIVPSRLVISVAILGIWLAAIQLAIYGEYLASGIAALTSWLGALIDSFLRR